MFCLLVSAIYVADLIYLVNSALLWEGGETLMSETSYNFSTNKSKKVKHIQGGEKKVMKKSLSILLAIAMVFTMFSGVAFAAEKTAGEQLKDLGVITGTLSGDLQEESTWDRQDIAVILSRLLDLEAEAEATAKTHTYADATDDFYDGYLSWAKAEGYLEGHSEVRFGYNEAISNHQFVAVMLRALGYDTTGTNYEGAKALSVELGLVAEGTDFTSEAVRGTYYTVILAALDTNMKDTEVTLGADLGLEGYAVEQGVSSVSVVGTKLIEVKFNTAVTDTADLGFKIKRGAAVYSSSVEWNDAKDTATLTAVINLPAADYTVEITGLVEGEVVTKEVTVVAAAASAIEVVSQGIALVNNSQITFKVSNQYGQDMEVDGGDITASAYNVTQGKEVVLSDVAGTSSKVQTPANFESGAVTELGDVVRVTLSYKGFTVQANLTVIANAAGDVISLGDIVLAEDDLRLNVSDTEVELAYTLLDQYGEEVELSDQAFANSTVTIDGVQFISSDISVISQFKTADGKLYLNPIGDGSATITAIINASGNVATATVTVEKDAEATAAVIAVPTTIVAGMDSAFDIDLTVTDQFGTVIDTKTGLTATIDLGGAPVPVINSDASAITIDLSGTTVNATTDVTVEVEFGGDVIGSIEFEVEPDAEALEIKSASFATVLEDAATYTVVNGDLDVVDQYGRSFEKAITIASDDANVIANAGTDLITATGIGTATLTVTVDSKTIEVDVEVIAVGDSESYTLSDIGTIYADSSATVGNAGTTAHEVTASLNGVYEGKEVVLAAGNDAPDFITTSNSAVADVSGTDVYGISAGTATISAWKDGKKVASTTVTVSEAKPVATTVEFDATTIDDGDSINVTAKDQYGVVITTSVFFTGGTLIDSNGATVDNAGTDTETITVHTSNGVTATEDITITNNN